MSRIGNVLSVLALATVTMLAGLTPATAQGGPQVGFLVIRAWQDAGGVFQTEAYTTSTLAFHAASCTPGLVLAPLTTSCGPVAHGVATASQGMVITAAIGFTGEISSQLGPAPDGSGGWALSCTLILVPLLPPSCAPSGTPVFGIPLNHACATKHIVLGTPGGVGLWGCSASES